MTRLPFRRQRRVLPTLVTVLCVGLVRCGGGGDPASPVTPPVTITAVSIAPSSASLVPGESVKLALTVTTSNGANSTTLAPTWTSSAPTVASVSTDGTVAALAAGSATVTASVGGKSATIPISVLSVASVAVSPVSAALVEGDTLSAQGVATLSNGTSSARTATWTSSAPSVASVSTSGRITALVVGTTNVTATIGGVTGSASVTVARRAASITLNITARSLNPSETLTLVPSIRFSDSTVATGKTVLWSTSAATTATVSQTGVVTALTAGSTTVTATVDGRVATALIVVRAPATTTLNTAAVVTRSIGPNGGTLTTTAAGATYTLEIPAGALTTEVAIRMTPITTIGNLPLSGGLVAAVDLQPSGLRFAKAATLRVNVGALPRAGLTLAGFSMNDNGTKVARALAAGRANEVIVEVAHFTAAGAAFGTAVDVSTMQPSIERSVQGAAFYDRFFDLASTNSTDGAAIIQALIGWFDVDVLPGLQNATDDLSLISAIQGYDSWANLIFIVFPTLPVSANDPALVLRRAQFKAAIAPKLQAVVRQSNQFCNAQPALTAMRNVLFWQSQAQIFGVASGDLNRSTVLATLCGQVRTISNNLVNPLQSAFPNDLDAVFGLQIGEDATTPQPVTITFSADRNDVAFAKSSPANSNGQGAFTVAVTAFGNTTFQVNLIACLILEGATDVCGQQSFNRTSLDVSGTYTGRFSSTIRTPTGTNFPVNVPLNVTLTQNQNGVTGTYNVMQFNGPRGSVSATLVGDQLLNFTLNQFAPCSGTLNGAATFALATRNLTATYTGADCSGTHSNGSSTLAPGTTALIDFAGAWTQALHASGFPLMLWRIAQTGNQVRLSFSTYNVSQQRMECRARFRGTVNAGSEVFQATLTDAIGGFNDEFSVSASTIWSPDLLRQRGARISTSNAGPFSGSASWFLTGNVPPGCDP